jgi:hypothetical protein
VHAFVDQIRRWRMVRIVPAGPYHSFAFHIYIGAH